MKNRDRRGKGVAALLLLALLLNGCSAEEARSEETESERETIAFSSEMETKTSETETQWNVEDEYIEYTDGIFINLDAMEAGEGCVVSESVFTITTGGTYVISGTLADGRIVVDTEKTEEVRLVLQNASVFCSNGSPLEIKSAKKAVVALPDGTLNSLGVGEGETEDAAGIFSRADLTVNGGGKLIVTAGSGDGVRSKGVLRITGGELLVTAADRGLVGKDAVILRDANADITSVGDGIKSNNSDDPNLGYVSIESGVYRIVSQGDGVQAETRLSISGGSFDITTGTGSYERESEKSFGGGFMNRLFGFGADDGADEENDVSQKGLKAGTELNVSGGEIKIDAYDDALHSNDAVTITGGAITAASGDDGIHADGAALVSGGEIVVSRSYEGIEGKNVTITGGVISIVASDDGLNATDGTGDVVGQFSSNRGVNETEIDVYIRISGGELTVDAGGDGIDSNGTLTIEGGVVIVFGPSDGANGYIDTAGSFWMNGGTYFGIGSSEMLVKPASDSQQASVTVTGDSYPAGAVVVVRDGNGGELFSVEAARAFNAVTFSSAEIDDAESCQIYVDGQLMENKSSAGGFGFGFGGGNKGGGRGDKQQSFRNGEEPSGGFGDGEEPSGGFGDGVEPPDGFGDGVEPPDGFGNGVEPPDGFGDGVEPPDGFGDGVEPPDGFGDGVEPPNGFGNGEEPSAEKTI